MKVIHPIKDLQGVFEGCSLAVGLMCWCTLVELDHNTLVALAMKAGRSVGKEAVSFFLKEPGGNKV